MHPDDVADLVAEEVDDLRAALADRPELRCGEVGYDGRFEILVPFTKRASQVAQAPTGTGLVVPFMGQVNQLAQVVHAGIVLDPKRQKELVLTVNCAGWDGQPPEVDFTWPDGRQLTPAEWPQSGPDRLGIVPYHPKYPRPFICRDGLREFHEHDWHGDQPWDGIREAYTLPQILVPILEDLQFRWTLPA